MSAPVRIWRYEIDEVWGTTKTFGPAVGTVILDTWKSDRCWRIVNFETGEEGGWHAKLLGEASPELATQVRAAWAQERATA